MRRSGRTTWHSSLWGSSETAQAKKAAKQTSSRTRYIPRCRAPCQRKEQTADTRPVDWENFFLRAGQHLWSSLFVYLPRRNNEALDVLQVNTVCLPKPCLNTSSFSSITKEGERLSNAFGSAFKACFEKKKSLQQAENKIREETSFMSEQPVTTRTETSIKTPQSDPGYCEPPKSDVRESRLP